MVPERRSVHAQAPAKRAARGPSPRSSVSPNACRKIGELLAEPLERTDLCVAVANDRIALGLGRAQVVIDVTVDKRGELRPKTRQLRRRRRIRIRLDASSTACRRSGGRLSRQARRHEATAIHLGPAPAKISLGRLDSVHPPAKIRHACAVSAAARPTEARTTIPTVACNVRAVDCRALACATSRSNGFAFFGQPLGEPPRARAADKCAPRRSSPPPAVYDRRQAPRTARRRSPPRRCTPG